MLILSEWAFGVFQPFPRSHTAVWLYTRTEHQQLDSCTAIAVSSSSSSSSSLLVAADTMMATAGSAQLCCVLLCCAAMWVASHGKGQAEAVVGHGYQLVSLGDGPDGSLVGKLELIQPSSTYGPDIPRLQLYVKQENSDRIRVQITDADSKRWEVPYNLLPRAAVPADLKTGSLGTSSKFDLKDGSVFEFSATASELVFSCVPKPFGYAIKRRSNGDVLFNSSQGSLVFKDQYLQIDTALPPAASLYGLGENTQPHGIKIVPNEAYTLYTTDISAINLNIDLYGSHPFYMDLRPGGIAHGVLLLNSNGMDIFYTGTSLTYKIIGGLLDFYYFAGPSPLDVVRQYTDLIGRPAAMPYWAFGFHQCRWGYQNLSVVEDVVYNYNKSQIPLDVIWNDDDHMDHAKDFTLDPVNYPQPKLASFLDRIHANGMKYVVLIDPGIAVNTSYGVFQRAMAEDIFIKHDGAPFLGQVWPGAVHFPDFLHPKAAAWWKDEIRRFRELAAVDGLWIDMNEISNFCSGKCSIPKDRVCPGPGVVWQCCLDCHNITDTRWDVPPYAINASGQHLPLGFKTVAASAVHYGGVREYDAHSLFGFSQTVATHAALQDLTGRRPFVLTRSTFVGSGAYAAHWTGDNKATWEDLRYSVSTILNFGMFGVPMVGSDICGFYPYTTEELCGRWIQLGAFYPFSRDHANYASTRQEVYQWPSVAHAARKALGLRYRLLPYLYTLNYGAHTAGYPIARPLFFAFPSDSNTYGISEQFMLGPALLVSPVLLNASTSVKAYMPRGAWYNLFDLTAVDSVGGAYVTLPAPPDTINVHVGEGNVVAMQGGGLTSAAARRTPFTLVVALPLGRPGHAQGELFLDDGDDVDMKLASGTSSYVRFSADYDGKRLRLTSVVEHGEFAQAQGWRIHDILILGASSSSSSAPPVKVELNGSPLLDSSVRVSASADEYYYSSSDKIGSSAGGVKRAPLMTIAGLSLPVGASFQLSISS